MNLLGFGGFRTHILLPHDVVGSIIDDRPTFAGLEIQSTGATDVYLRYDKPVLRVKHRKVRNQLRVTVTALQNVWVQEMGLTVRVQGGGEWRGYNRHGWTTDVYTLKGVPDAQRATVHFPRYKTSPRYTTGVEYREGDQRWRFRSGTGFSRLLNQHTGPVPWQGCQVFSREWELQGVVRKMNASPVRVWELAHHPDSAWMHFHGWAGGAGAVVQAVPPYRADQVLHPDVPIDHLWDPATWQHMSPGKSVSQVLIMER